jgi:hypothetical protein
MREIKFAVAAPLAIFRLRSEATDGQARGFANHGLILEAHTQAPRKLSRLPWAITFRPFQGFQFAASQTVGNYPTIGGQINRLSTVLTGHLFNVSTLPLNSFFLFNSLR